MHSLESFDLIDDQRRQVQEAKEFLEHNELELAMDSLAEAAAGLEVPQGFWDGVA